MEEMNTFKENTVHIFLIVFSVLNVYLSYNLSFELKELELSQKILIEDLNVTRHSNTNILFFNRITKVGSSAFGIVVGDLSRRNNFSFFTYNISPDGVDNEITAMGPE